MYNKLVFVFYKTKVTSPHFHCTLLVETAITKISLVPSEGDIALQRARISVTLEDEHMGWGRLFQQSLGKYDLSHEFTIHKLVSRVLPK